MTFRTEVHTPESPVKIELSSPIVSLGSCFADTMGQRLQHLKLTTLNNPFGIIYNPLSILSLVNKCLKDTDEIYFPEEGFLEREGRWYHDALHTTINATSKEGLTTRINALTQQVSKALKAANWLIITPGTAHVYEYQKDDRLVANCHKLPGTNFKRRMLDVTEITEAFQQTYQLLKYINPKVRILLTVSPVRHIRDTIPVNTISKSTLLLASHYLRQTLEDVHYFPSYELMIDDLRDYRFYKRDMIHPSEEAEDYIWSKFSQAFFSAELQTFEKQWDKILKSLQHRPFNPASDQHQAFLHKLLTQLENLASKIDVEQEIQQVKQQLI